MQLTCVEFARHVLGLEGANSFELDPETKYPIIDIMRDQIGVEDLGGTLRLGLYPSKLKRGSKAAAAYDNQEVVQRRHRHRYEFNNDFREQFEKAGFVFSGVSPDNRLVEIVEIPENKFFVACQYHPELQSRPNRPEGLYTAFVSAAMENENKYNHYRRRLVSFNLLYIFYIKKRKRCQYFIEENTKYHPIWHHCLDGFKHYI